MARPGWLASFLGLGLGLAACCGALPADVATKLAKDERGAERLVLEVELESPHLSGLFDAVLITRASPPAVRLQLLPEMGAPILDVVAQPMVVSAYLHGGGTTTWRGQPDDPPPGLGLLFGITLLEQHTPLAPVRVRCFAAAEPPRLTAVGLFPGTSLTDAELSGSSITARTFHYGPIAWRDRQRPDGGEVTGRGFSLRAKVREREAAPDLTDDDFVLAGGR